MMRFLSSAQSIFIVFLFIKIESRKVQGNPIRSHGSDFNNLDRIRPGFIQGFANLDQAVVKLVGYLETDNLKNFLASLFDHVKQSHKGFSQSKSEASTQISELSSEQSDIQASVDTENENLHQKSAEKEANQQELSGQESVLRQSETTLQNQRKNLENAEKNVRKLEQKVHDAKHCFRRRKRGLFDSIGNFFKKTIYESGIKKAAEATHDHVLKPTYTKVLKPVGEGTYDHVLKPTYTKVLKPIGEGTYDHVLKPAADGVELGICAVVNEITKNLRDARKHRNNARNDLNKQARRVESAKRQIQGTKERISSLTQSIRSLQDHITSLNSQIAELNQRHRQIISIKEKLEKADEFLSSLASRIGTSVYAIKTSQAALLIQEIEEVINFEGVIQPILDAGEILAGNTDIQLPEMIELNAETTQEILGNLRMIKIKLESVLDRYGDVSLGADDIDWGD